jgi:hypothetical protein
MWADLKASHGTFDGRRPGLDVVGCQRASFSVAFIVKSGAFHGRFIRRSYRARIAKLEHLEVT